MRVDLSLASNQTPLAAAAVVMALSMLFAGGIANNNMKLNNRFGIGPTLLLATGIQAFLIIATTSFLIE